MYLNSPVRGCRHRVCMYVDAYPVSPCIVVDFPHNLYRNVSIEYRSRCRGIVSPTGASRPHAFRRLRTTLPNGRPGRCFTICSGCPLADLRYCVTSYELCRTLCRDEPALRVRHVLPGLHYLPDENNSHIAPSPMISFGKKAAPEVGTAPAAT